MLGQALASAGCWQNLILEQVQVSVENIISVWANYSNINTNCVIKIIVIGLLEVYTGNPGKTRTCQLNAHTHAPAHSAPCTRTCALKTVTKQLVMAVSVVKEATKCLGNRRCGGSGTGSAAAATLGRHHSHGAAAAIVVGHSVRDVVETRVACRRLYDVGKQALV